VTGRAAAAALALFGSAAMAQPAPVDVPVAGDPVEGRRIVEDRALSACTLCHAGPFPAPHLHGTIGPTLDGVADRLPPDAIRARIVDARQFNPDTVMPPYHVTDGMARVGRAWAGRPILSARQVEDVVAFLSTLKTPGSPPQ